MLEPKALIREHIASGASTPLDSPYPGVAFREFVSSACGAVAFSTGTATFETGAKLPYHTHEYSEAVTILAGDARVFVEGRMYRLGPLDCIHIPAAAAHSLVNPSSTAELIALWAFANASPSRQLVPDVFPAIDRTTGDPCVEDPEYIVRHAIAEKYELSDGALFCDLFSARYGARGICGGCGVFTPGSSLPCHVHRYDESITIISGEAICKVAGRNYRLSGCDTAFVPEGQPHRFLNQSSEVMTMVWVYAGDEPERTIIDARYCDGVLPWTPTS